MVHVRAGRIMADRGGVRPAMQQRGRAPIEPQHNQVVAVGQRVLPAAAVPGAEQQRVREGRVRHRAVRRALQQAVRVPATKDKVLLVKVAYNALSRQRAPRRHTVCRNTDTETCSHLYTLMQDAAHLPRTLCTRLSQEARAYSSAFATGGQGAQALYLPRLTFAQLLQQHRADVSPPEVQLAPAAVLGLEGPNVAADRLKGAAAHHDDLLVNIGCRMVRPSIKGHACIALVPLATGCVVADHIRKECVPASGVREA